MPHGATGIRSETDLSLLGWIAALLLLLLLTATSGSRGGRSRRSSLNLVKALFGGGELNLELIDD